MSVYLGQDKVGISYFEKANTYKDYRSVMLDDYYTPWTRPEGWPDLDSLNLSMSGDDDFIYMTFRAGNPDDVFCCGWNLVPGGSITIDAGQIENGEFVSTAKNPYTSSSNTTLGVSLESIETDFIVIKVTGRFQRFYLLDVTTSDNRTIKYYMQPVLERIWYVPHMVSFFNGSSASTSGNGTITLERDKIANGNGTALISMSYAWCNCYKLLSLDITGLQTPKVENMSSAFGFCRNLEVLDVSNFNTAKVITMNSMFDNCNRLKQLDLSNWNTEKLTGSGVVSMFRACRALKLILGLENFYTNNLTSLDSIFNECNSLSDLSGITNWNIGNVTNIAKMFYDCFSIKTLDLSNWNVGKITNVLNTFYYCHSLERIYFPKVLTATISGSMNSMFSCCYNLQEIDLNWIKPITNAVTNIGYLCYNCRSITELNFPEGWDVTGCTGSDSCLRIFSDCYRLERVTGISNWDMSNYNYSMAYQFEYDISLKELDIKNWCPHPTTMYLAFYHCDALEEVDLTGWHWENMTGTSLASTFAYSYSLKTIKGIGSMGSGNNTTCANMFTNCWSLTSIPDISGWDMSKVTSCNSMFYNCYSLESLTISNWSLPKCTNMTNMFRYCYNMRELELTGWTISGLTTAPDDIFAGLWNLSKCSGLPIGLNHSYRENWSLPESQWERIFTQLPTVSGKTLRISTNNLNRISATTKAIATNKGWTLAD